MRHYYFCILTALSLALMLPACSSDHDGETSRRRSPKSADPASTQRANTTTGTAPDAEAPATAPSRRRNTVLAPADEPTAPLLAPRPVRRRARRAPALPVAAAIPVSQPATVEKTPVAAEPDVVPPSGTATEAPAPDATKQAQVFLIRPDRDTVLYGPEGTVMRIPAGTFVQGKGTAPKGLVEIRLREFYSMADILLERLNTQAGPHLLETGGMVQISARTTDGRECKLKPGSEFELGFPATRPIDGMQLYAGQHTNGHGLNWKLAPQDKTKKRKPLKDSVPWHRPRFKGGYAATRRRLRRKIAYDPATMRRLTGYDSPAQVRRQYKRVPVVGTVQASFELSKWGKVEDVWVRNASQTDSALQAAVRQALLGLVAQPSYRGFDATRCMLKVDVRFTADRRVQVGRLRWDQRTTAAFYRADKERQTTGRGRLTDAQLQAAPLSELTGELFKKNRASARRYSVGTFLGEQLNYVKELAVFRVMVVAAPQAVDYYNCDRPVPPLLTRLTSPSRIRAPKGGLAKLALVRLGLDYPTSQPADISLVLRDRRSVLRGNPNGSRVMFEQLADSTVGTLVAIRREQDQLYLGMRDVVVSQRTEPPLAFRPVTVAELREALARFDL